MRNIDEVLHAFLQEQNNRLKKRTYDDYEDVIHFFRIYLNDYAPNYLDEQEYEQWKAQFKEDSECYTRMFGPEKLSSSNFSEFLEYFVIRKVASGESFRKRLSRS